MVREKSIKCDFGAKRGKLKKRSMGPSIHSSDQQATTSTEETNKYA